MPRALRIYHLRRLHIWMLCARKTAENRTGIRVRSFRFPEDGEGVDGVAGSLVDVGCASDLIPGDAR